MIITWNESPFYQQFFDWFHITKLFFANETIAQISIFVFHKAFLESSQHSRFLPHVIDLNFLEQNYIVIVGLVELLSHAIWVTGSRTSRTKCNITNGWQTPLGLKKKKITICESESCEWQFYWFPLLTVNKSLRERYRAWKNGIARRLLNMNQIASFSDKAHSAPVSDVSQRAWMGLSGSFVFAFSIILALVAIISYSSSQVIIGRLSRFIENN